MGLAFAPFAQALQAAQAVPAARIGTLAQTPNGSGLSLDESELWRNSNGELSYRIKLRNNQQAKLLAIALEFRAEGIETCQGIKAEAFAGGGVMAAMSTREFTLPSNFKPKWELDQRYPSIEILVKYAHFADGRIFESEAGADVGFKEQANRTAAVANSVLSLVSRARTAEEAALLLSDPARFKEAKDRAIADRYRQHLMANGLEFMRGLASEAARVRVPQ